MKISLCPSPDLYHLYRREGAVVIVVDIFRATTTMVTAFQAGAEAIRPVDSIEVCQTLGEAHGYLMAAERHVKRCAFAQLGNDPAEYTPEVVSGKRIVMTTTNGTRSIEIARQMGAQSVLVGSYLNLSATVTYCASMGAQEVVVVGAGWQGQASLEDCLYAGAFAYYANTLGVGVASGDMALMMQELWMQHGLTEERSIALHQRSEHFVRLESAGFANVLPYCLTLDTTSVVVGLDKGGEWLVRLA